MPTTTPTVKHYPTGPPMLLESIAPLSGTTVGVAMPISMVFTHPVKVSARRRIEQHIRLTTSVPVTGAWHWFGLQRVDFRPKTFWPPGTRVSMVARFDHVGDGHGRYGIHSYTRTFKIGADVRTHVYVNRHRTVVTRNGKTLRTMPSNAGSPQFPTWEGTMAVVSKSRTVRMTSCSVGIACNPGDPNYYDLVLPWDVRITSSGTFVHYSTADPYPGQGNASHGCVHLSYADARWFYNLSKQGDPVTITGTPRGKAAGDNGYADFDVPWRQWLAGSGMKQFTTHT
jgi:lipoprotein-anchoring transpeptidase ErfK/SrfK